MSDSRRLLIVGGATPRHPTSTRWRGWSVDCRPRLLAQLGLGQVRAFDAEGLTRIARDALRYDLVFCEVDEALCLHSAWRRLGARRPILALATDGAASIRRARRALGSVGEGGSVLTGEVEEIFDRWEERIVESEIVGGVGGDDLDAFEDELDRQDETESLKAELASLRERRTQ